METEIDATAMFDVTVVGSINVDQVLRLHRHPSPGETVLGTALSVNAGGKGANQAVAAALQGARVAFVGAYGENYQDVALEYLRDSGVDLEGVVEVPGPTGFAAIQVSDDGENSIVVLPGANSHVNEDFVRNHGQCVQRSKIVLLQGEIPAGGFSSAIKIARSAGSRVIVNLAPVIDVDKKQLLEANPLIANQHEARLILHNLGVEAPEEASYEQIADLLCAAGFRSVVLTLGAQGALWAETDEHGTLLVGKVPSPVVTAIDTTGAGDAFAGALVAQLASYESLPNAVEHAVRVGAFAVQYPGAQQSYPNRYSELPNID